MHVRFYTSRIAEQPDPHVHLSARSGFKFSQLEMSMNTHLRKLKYELNSGCRSGPRCHGAVVQVPSRR